MLDTKDVELIGEMIATRLDAAFSRYKLEVDPEVQKDRQFLRHQRITHEEQKQDRRARRNSVIAGIALFVLIGALNMWHTIVEWFKRWVNGP